MKKMTVGELLDHPDLQGRISPDKKEAIIQSLSVTFKTEENPLYVRILFGLGAWFAAGFLISSMGMFFVFNNGMGSMMCGAVLLFLAISVGKAARTIFLDQLSLACAFAGNFLVLMGSAVMLRDSVILVILISHTVVLSIVYPLYNSKIYRFIAPIALAILATAEIFASEALYLLHGLITAETLCFGFLLLYERRSLLLTPLLYSAALMLPATLLFVNFMNMGVWYAEYATPLWPSSLVITAGLVYFYLHLAGGLSYFREPWLMLSISSTLLLGLFTTPGVLVALGLMIAGYAFSDRILTAMSFCFLPCFLVVFYYSMAITLAYKSAVVLGSGILLLVIRWIAGKLIPGEGGT